MSADHPRRNSDVKEGKARGTHRLFSIQFFLPYQPAKGRAHWGECAHIKKRSEHERGSFVRFPQRSGENGVRGHRARSAILHASAEPFYLHLKRALHHQEVEW